MVGAKIASGKGNYSVYDGAWCEYGMRTK